MRRMVMLVALAAVVAGCGTVTSGELLATTSLQPHMLGWEQHLSISWEVGQQRGRPVVSGYVHNNSPLDLANVRVLVDSLDATGRVVEQRIGWLPGELRGGGQLYFEVNVAPAPTYRVRVYTYDRLESASLMN
jgi:hypothetical protein